jgi:hypothetical protein
MVMERKQRNGQLVITYGSTNHIEDSNVQPAAWCLDAWTLGADGVLPWQTVGNADSWKTADPLALFYPGKEPVPSVRLKAYRRGEQDVEYLTLLQKATGVSRETVEELVRRELKLSGTFTQRNEEDAGTTEYTSLDPAALWQLRVRIARKVDLLTRNVGAGIVTVTNGVAAVPSGGSFAGECDEIALVSQLGVHMPGVWVQERFTSTTFPPGFGGNNGTGFCWSTAGTEDGAHLGNFYYDYVFYEWAESTPPMWDHFTLNHHYWAGTKSITQGGIDVGSWTMSFTRGLPYFLGTVTHAK